MTVMISPEQSGIPSERPTIVVIDRQVLSRTSLTRILRDEMPAFAVEEIASTHDIASLAGRPIELLILNIHGRSMADSCVVQCIAHLRRAMAREPLMLITQQDEASITDAVIADTARAGVRGFVTDRDGIEIVLAALKLVIAGGAYFPRSVLLGRGVEEAPPMDEWLDMRTPIAVGPIAAEAVVGPGGAQVAFTQREREVIATLQRGLSNKIIANELKLSQNTVKVHISRIMRKLKATNRTEAALAVQRTLLNVDA